MMAADQRSLDRLAKICGMFGSDQLGERAAAAQRAEAIRVQMGLSWSQLLAGAAGDQSRRAPPSFDPATADPAAILARCSPILTAWEREFLASISSQRVYSQRQTLFLNGIREKCSIWWANGGRA